MNYGERINELLSESKLTPEKLSEEINVSRSTVYRWKKCETELCLSNLVALANFFNCSVDYLLCRSEDMSYCPAQNCPPFSKRLREVMKEKGVSTYTLRKTTRYDSKYFQKWDKGADPQASTLIELATILDCSVDYLIGKV